MKKIMILSILGVFLVGPNTLFAETSRPKEVRDEIRTERSEMRSEIKEKVETMRVENKGSRDEFRDNASETKRAAREEIKVMRESGAKESEIKEKIDSLKETVKADREALKVKLEERRKIMKTEIEAQIASFKADKKVKLDSAKKESVKTKLNGVFTRLGNAIAKLGTFDTKISAAIESKKASGLNTADAENALTVARTSLDDAKIALDAVSQAVTSSIDDASGTSREAIKGVIIKAQTSIKTAHTKYQEVIKLLPKSRTASSTNN